MGSFVRIHTNPKLRLNPVKKKKKRKPVAKRKVKTKRKQQRKPKSVNKDSKYNVQTVYRPAISDIEVPPGFRAVAMSHAMMAYIEPIMDFVEKGVIKDPNDALQLAMPLWNYTNRPEQDDNMRLREEIVSLIGKALKFEVHEASEFFDYMIKRKEHLFPAEMQPDDPMVLFMRKEEHFLIPELHYHSLDISDETFPPDKEDRKLVELIEQLDRYIEEEVDYTIWEDHYFSMEAKSKDRFAKWLKKKGLEEYVSDFPFCVEVFMGFVYRYVHEEKVTLKSVPPTYMDEFFTDYVLRKVLIEPCEYAKWPPALQTFYDFLYEKGYIRNPERVKSIIGEIEPYFIQVLRDRFS